KIGDTWYSYSQAMGPLALSFAAVAAFHDAFSKSGDAPTEDRIAEAAGVIGSAIIDQSFFKGLQGLNDALSDPKRYAGQFVGSVLGGGIPLSGQTRTVAEQIDPIVRKPETIYERILSGVPLASKQVPARLDVFGRETNVRDENRHHSAEQQQHADE